jgi:hypothetical protein
VKAILLLAFAAAVALGEGWDDIIANGNFTTGKTHWQGDGDVTAAGGTLFLNLKRDRWTVVSQKIAEKSSNLELKVTYSLSNFCSLRSRRSADEPVMPLTSQALKNATGLSKGIPDLPLDAKADWMVFLLNDGRILRAVPVTLSAGESDPYTFATTFIAERPFVNEVLCFAFPPGKGMVTIANVQLLRAR